MSSAAPAGKDAKRSVVEVRIRSYFSLATDLAAEMRSWPEFVGGTGYAVELASPDGAETVSIAQVDEVDDPRAYVRVTASFAGLLFERALGRVIYAMAAHSDHLLVERSDEAAGFERRAPDFELVFRDRRVARVWQSGSDFPGFHGRYELFPEARHDPDLREVFEYHDYSVRVAPQFEQNQALSASDLEEELGYQSLIDSPAWALVRGDGDRQSILIPVFGSGGEINWRFP